MKTVTEFSGFFLRGALKIRQDLFQKKKKEQKDKELEEKKAPKVAEVKSEENAETIEASTEVKAEQSESVLESTQIKEDIGTQVESIDASPKEEAISESVQDESGNKEIENKTEELVSTSASTEPASETTIEESEVKTDASSDATSTLETQVTEAEKDKEEKITLFNVEKKLGQVKQVKQKPKAWVEVSDEELKAALSEGLKLEGEKLDHVLNAVKAIDRKREEDLKRIVVCSLDEGEKQPEGSRLFGTHVYTAEYLPSLRPPPQDPRKKFGNKRGGKGGKRFDNKRGKFGDKKRGDRKEGRSYSGAPGEGGSESEKRNFRPRKPFPRKPMSTATETARGPLKITPKGESTPPAGV